MGAVFAGALAIGAGLLLATPAHAAYPPTQCSATISDSTVTVGESVTTSGDCFAAGETVEGVVHSDPVNVGSTQANGQGDATLTFKVPNVPAGQHTLDLNGQTSGNTASTTFTVVSEAGAGGGPGATGTNNGGLAFTGAAGIASMTAAGVALILAGTLSLAVVRRRRHTAQA